MHSAERLEIVKGHWFAKFSAPLPLVAAEQVAVSNVSTRAGSLA
jgi:hypothetical protein